MYELKIVGIFASTNALVLTVPEPPAFTQNI
jgi:hypothetical protein